MTTAAADPILGARSARRRRIGQGVFWLGVYLVLTFAPVVLLMATSPLPGRGFWHEFSVALGFAGLAMMGLQFVLTARFKGVKAPYGSDIIYYFHRQISLVAFALIVAHPVILFVSTPETLQLLNVWEAPWRARAGVASLVALLVLIAMSVWRQALRIEYDTWRRWHSILAVAAVVLAFGHVLGVGHYVDTPPKRALWITYGALWVGLLVYVRVVMPWQQLRRAYRVARVTEERGNAWTVTLEPHGHAGLRFAPGQFAWLTIGSSPFSNTDHPFSFSSSAAQPNAIQFTIKERGDFTAQIKHLVPGEPVYLDGPHGAFTIDRHSDAPGYVFVAGGVGITPIMSMLRTLADRRDQRPVVLIYANKTWDDITFRDELALLESRLNLRVVYVLEQPPLQWNGETGWVTAALLARYLGHEQQRYEYFVCGPEPMMDAVERALHEHGVPLGNVHSERFNLV